MQGNGKMGNINVGIETPKKECRTWNTILGRIKNTIVSSHQKLNQVQVYTNYSSKYVPPSCKYYHDI